MSSTNSPQSNSPNKLKFAGDVNIQEVIVTSLISGNSYNITNQIATVYIYEDLFSPFMTGELAVLESLDFASNFPFVGEEVVDLKIYTPTMEKNKNGIIQGRFYIYKMSDRTELLDRNVIYKLNFISIEAIADLNSRISKGYKGIVSDIAKQILVTDDEISVNKEVNIEPTKNKIRYISNFWSPIKNINYLLEHALSTKDTATYTFFENRQGYNFVSLDTLNDGPVKQEFVQNNSSQQVDPSGGSKRDVQIDYKRIQDLTVATTYDYMDRLRSGAYGSQLLYMDLSTKKYYNVKHSFIKDWERGKRLNGYPIASQNIYATYRSSMLNSVVENGLFTDFEDVSNIQFRQKRISRLKQAEAFKINITVAGRTDYTVGQVVKVTKFKAEPIKKEDKQEDALDPIISGKYLVSAINHIINRQKHECQMELIKDSLDINLNKGAKK